MKPIWNDYIDNNYFAKILFWVYRKRTDGSIMDFRKFEVGEKVEQYIVENEEVGLAYTPTLREIVSTSSQGIKFKDEIDQNVELQYFKNLKISELKTARDTAEESPVHIELGDFDFDTKARDRINGAKDVLKGTDNKLEWTLANNKVVSVGYNELKAVTDMAAVRCNTLHLKYRDLRDLVNSCTNVSDVGKINWGVINQ